MAVKNLSPHAIRELISRYEVELHKLQFQLERTEQTIEELRQAIPQAEQREAGKRRAKLNGGSREREAAEETAASSEAAEATAADGGSSAAPEAGAEEQATPKRRGRRAGRPAKAGATAAATEAAAAPSAPAEETPVETEEKPRRRGRPKGTTTKAKTKTTGRGKAKPGRKKAAKDRSSGYRLSKYDELILQALDDRNKVMITNELQDFVEEQIRNEGQPVDPEEVRLRISRSLQKLVNRRKDLIKVPYEGRGFAYGRQNWFNKEGELKSKYGR